MADLGQVLSGLLRRAYPAAGIDPGKFRVPGSFAEERRDFWEALKTTRSEPNTSPQRYDFVVYGLTIATRDGVSMCRHNGQKRGAILVTQDNQPIFALSFEKDRDIDLIAVEPVSLVEKDGDVIRQIVTEDGQCFAAAEWCDASYEGRLTTAACSRGPARGHRGPPASPGR